MTLLNRLFNLTLKSFLFLLPLFFLPLTTDWYEFNKLYLFYTATAILLLIWAGKMLLTKTFYIHTSKLDLPLFLVLLAAVTSTIFSQNHYYSLQVTIDALPTIVALYLFYYAVASNSDFVGRGFMPLRNGSDVESVWEPSPTNLLTPFAYGATIAAILYLLKLFNIEILGHSNFNTLGNVQNTLLTFTLGVVIAASEFVGRGFIPRRNADDTSVTEGHKAPPYEIIRRFLTAAILTVLLLALIISGNLIFLGLTIIGLIFVGASLSVRPQIKKITPYLISMGTIITAITFAVYVPQAREAMGIKITRQTQLTPSLQASWIAATSSLGQFPIAGVGLNNFRSIYGQFKPLSVNSTESWNLLFSQGANFWTTLLASQGLVGFLAWLLLTAVIIRRSSESKELKPLLVVTLLSTLILPGSVTVLAVLFLLTTTIDHQTAITRKPLPNLAYSAASVVTLIVTASAFFGYRIYAADYYFYQSLNNLAENGGKAYQYQQQAISLNPYSDIYHCTYAETNLALAAALTKQVQTDVEAVPSEEDIKALLDQATREIKIATETLGPGNPDNWEARGNIYQSLASTANNTLSWTVNAYQTAISLNPYNPRLRLALGGVYFANKDYQNAAQNFLVAVQLKNDYGNAHYNLAYAYKALGDNKSALIELKTVRNLLKTEDPEYTKIAGEIEELSNNIASVGEGLVPSRNSDQTAGLREGIKPSPTNTSGNVAGAQTQASPSAKPKTGEATPTRVGTEELVKTATPSAKAGP